MCPAELASEKNQVMDALLDRPQVPPDYGDVMIGLYRDKSQDVLTRAFAVQHIVLYARDLNRRGEYDPGSADARYCRKALFAAASETRTVVAAAAFRKFGVCPQSAHSGMSHYSQRTGEYYADCSRSRGVCPQVFREIFQWLLLGKLLLRIGREIGCMQ